MTLILRNINSNQYQSFLSIKCLIMIYQLSFLRVLRVSLQSQFDNLLIMEQLNKFPAVKLLKKNWIFRNMNNRFSIEYNYC